MAKKAMSFKPTPECEVQLAELMDRWGCDRTAAVIRAIAVALDARSEVELSGQRYQPNLLPNDPKEVAKAVTKKPPPAPLGKPMTTLTREEREAKKPLRHPRGFGKTDEDTRTQQERMDDFYRSNMAKGKK